MSVFGVCTVYCLVSGVCLVRCVHCVVCMYDEWCAYLSGVCTIKFVCVFVVSGVCLCEVCSLWNVCV